MCLPRRWHALHESSALSCPPHAEHTGRLSAPYLLATRFCRPKRVHGSCSANTNQCTSSVTTQKTLLLGSAVEQCHSATTCNPDLAVRVPPLQKLAAAVNPNRRDCHPRGIGGGVASREPSEGKPFATEWQMVYLGERPRWSTEGRMEMGLGPIYLNPTHNPSQCAGAQN